MQERPSVRRKKKARTVSVILSFTAHCFAAFFVFFWAAREGALGTKLQQITVAIVPKEKPPEELPPPPPPKIEPPKEEPKPDLPKEIEPPKLVAAPPPPATVATPSTIAAAPAPTALPDFNFNDGAKPVATGTNGAMGLYRYQVEYALRSNWDRPDNIQDDSFVAEVELSVNPSGKITKFVFQKSSGNKRWDDSVKQAILATTSIQAPQPKDFIGKFIVRFDVLAATADLQAH